MSIGKGISEAVRNSIRDWLDDAAMQKMVKLFPLSTYTRGRLRNPDCWVRHNRCKYDSIWERTYDHSDYPRIKLRVDSNLEDTHILGYSIWFDGKRIIGAIANVPSILIDPSGKAKRKTAKKPTFRVLSDAELKDLQFRSEYAGGVESLLTERDV